MNTLLDLNIKFSQPAERDSISPTAVSTSTSQTASDTRPQSGRCPIAVGFSLTAAHSLEDRLALEAELFQFVLSESEAAFKSPIRHFFNPGGQQLHYNQN